MFSRQNVHYVTKASRVDREIESFNVRKIDTELAQEN